MNEVSERKVPWGMFLGIAVLSASLLAFQVLLTRVCALRLSFHFGFLIISNSLLGIGASGSFLTLFEGKWRKNPEKWIWGFSVLYVISLLATWQFARTFDVPEKIKFGFTGEELTQTLQFATYNLGLAVPFFFGGGAVGLILSAYSHRVNTVYASDLVGAALGCLLCPLLLWPVGAGGTLCAVVILGAITIGFVAPKSLKRPSWIGASVLAVGFAVWMPFFDSQFDVPGKKYLQATETLALNLDGEKQYSKWSANSRIDVIESPLGRWVAYGIGINDAEFALDPKNQKVLGEQKWIMQDGDAGTFVTDYTNSEKGREYLQRTLYSLTASVKSGTSPRVFVIGVGGAPDIWAHKLGGASYIKGIELNRGVLEVHDTVAKEFSSGLLSDPNIELVCDEGRSALMRDTSKYDIIQMTGIDTWTSLASGAYVLAENYLYTVEAVQQMYEHLNDDGIIQITRMGANMERLRLLVNVQQAFTNMGLGDMAGSIAVVTAQVDGLTSVMIKKGTFVEEEIARLEAFTIKSGHGKLYLPLRDVPENIVEHFVTLDDKDKFIRDFPRRITATTDDQPYFFNFTRWDSPPEEGLKYLDEATEVSQGNPWFLWGQLLISSVFAFVLIVVPLMFKRGAAKSAHAGRFLVYFIGIGVGFIFLEIALMQKLTLLLGQPLYSIVVTLFSILIFTGIGSFLSGPLLKGGVMVSRMIPVGIAVVTVAIVIFSDQIVASVIAEDLTTRALVAGAMTAPLALLLGMPFAHGVTLLRKLSPSFVPWAWAVNGSASVVGSVVTVIVSMNFGFSAVLIAAIFIYAIAFLAVDKLGRE
ncbi:MAG: spermidine synthase [Planctomycetota bacterium]|jgi:spermidine synthase